MSKTYTLKPTKHPRLFRIVDREGNWENYFLLSKVEKLPSGEFDYGKGKVLRGITTILGQGYPKGPGFNQWISTHSLAEQADILSAAGEKGDKVHRAIDIMLSGEPTLNREVGIFSRETKDYEPISNAEWDALLSFSRFWAAHEPVLLASEAPMYSVEGGYAGTADCLLILTKSCEVKMCKCENLVGKIGLLDWKTSGAIYPSYYAQIAAYAHAENINEYLGDPKAKVAYTAILRLGTSHVSTGGYEFKPQNEEETLQAMRLFCAAKQISDYEHKPFTFEDIEEIPDTIQITIKKPEKVEKVKKTRKPRAKKSQTKLI